MNFVDFIGMLFRQFIFELDLNEMEFWMSYMLSLVNYILIMWLAMPATKTVQ